MMGFEKPCGPCHGRGYYGSDRRDTCNVCDGAGEIYLEGTNDEQKPCRRCGGAGYYDTDQKATCDTCKGFGVMQKGIERRSQAFGVPQSLSPGDKNPRDRFFMEEAIKESLQSQNEDGRMHPSVGVIFERDDKIIGRGYRGKTGPGDHAEYGALEKNPSATVFAGSTAYTTFEPCTKRNEPKIACADRLIEHRVKRVVIGMLDPNPHITGKGVLKLREAGIETIFFDADLMSKVEEINRDFKRSYMDGSHLSKEAENPHVDKKVLAAKGISKPEQAVMQNQIGKFGVKDSSSFRRQLGLTIEQYNLASVLFLDLDNFKAVNDVYDHSTGDLVIRQALEAVQNVIGDKGELFHRSGDEMIVLLPKLNDRDARDVAERIRVAIVEKDFSVIGPGFVTTTIGLATYPDTCKRWEDLENTADQAANRAKKAGKNRVANCLEKLVPPPTVTDGELADAQFEIQRLDTLVQDRPQTDVVIAQTKLQQMFILEQLVKRLQVEGRPALAWKHQRQIRAIQLKGRVMTSSQIKVEKLNDIDADRNALKEEQERKKNHRRVLEPGAGVQ